MFKIGICNELFEDMEFSRVCRLLKRDWLRRDRNCTVHAGQADYRAESGAPS